MTKQSVSIWEFLFGGSLLNVSITLILIFLGIAIVIFFIQKLIYLQKQNKVDPYLIKNINDLLNDGRIQAAIDFCRRDNSPESRSVEKGLHRLGRPVVEISNAMETHAQIELNSAEKNLNYFATVSGAAPMLGILGSVIALSCIFGQVSLSQQAIGQDVLASNFYIALAPAVVGLAVGFLSYIFHNYLVSKVDYMVMKIQYHTNEFLDVINRPA